MKIFPRHPVALRTASAVVVRDTERNGQIYWAVVGGEPRKDVARRFGVSVARVHLIVHRHASRRRAAMNRVQTGWLAREIGAAVARALEVSEDVDYPDYPRRIRCA